MKRAASWTLVAIAAATVAGVAGLVLSAALATVWVNWGRHVDSR